MSLNNISLPSQLVADLYQKTLVQNIASAVPLQQNISFLGKNKKNILVVVNKKGAAYLPDGELSFLTTVLSACQLDLSDVAIVNWQKEKNVGEIRNQLNPKKLLLLDVDPVEFGLPAGDDYFVYSQEAFQYVTAPSLSVISPAVALKKSLWAALKQLFCL